jgi:hypothetical protein
MHSAVSVSIPATSLQSTPSKKVRRVAIPTCRVGRVFEHRRVALIIRGCRCYEGTRVEDSD